MLRRFALGPLSGEFEQVEEAFEAPAEGGLDQNTLIVLLGNLAQTYQFQIDFLRHLQQAGANGLTSESVHAWFRNTLATNPLTSAFEVEPLIGWLVDRTLLALREDDRYVLGPVGPQFIEAIQTFWYAPKVV